MKSRKSKPKTASKKRHTMRNALAVLIVMLVVASVGANRTTVPTDGSAGSLGSGAAPAAITQVDEPAATDSSDAQADKVATGSSGTQTDADAAQIGGSISGSSASAQADEATAASTGTRAGKTDAGAVQAVRSTSDSSASAQAGKATAASTGTQAGKTGTVTKTQVGGNTPASVGVQTGAVASARAQAGKTGKTADTLATNTQSVTVPSASAVAGADFLAALDAYVAADPAADSGDYVELDGNTPSFTAEDATTEAFQTFSQLDSLGRCGTAYACLGPETLPTAERGDIGEVHPTGWQHSDYDFVDGGSLYNRSHLIAFCLSGQNANERNLITGTRHMNADVMAPIELMVLDYIEQSGNHVLYRVTPVFEGDELVARGVQIEALSMEDGGQGVSLNVYLRNIQPGVAIDYATGDNRVDDTADVGAAQAGTASEQGGAAAPASETDGNAGAATAGGTADAGDAASGQPVGAAGSTSTAATAAQPDEATPTPAGVSYVVNTNTGKFHLPSCSSVPKIKEKNRLDTDATRDELIAEGYVPCKNCNP